jgi:hypothetical protein
VPALGVVEVALEPMSVPEAVPVLPVVPDAPMEVPLPVVSVLGVVGVVVEPAVVSLGNGVDGTVVVVLLDEVEVSGVAAVSSRSPQAVRDRAAIRARAAHVIGDLIIRNSFEGFVSNRESDSVRTRCLRLTLVAGLSGHVGPRCRSL